MPPRSMMSAAAMPVSSDTCAFQSSIGSPGSRSSRYAPCPSRISAGSSSPRAGAPSGSATTRVSGRLRLAPPRSLSRAERSAPNQGSAAKASGAVPPSTAACASA